MVTIVNYFPYKPILASFIKFRHTTHTTIFNDATLRIEIPYCINKGFGSYCPILDRICLLAIHNLVFGQNLSLLNQFNNELAALFVNWREMLLPPCYMDVLKL